MYNVTQHNQLIFEFTGGYRALYACIKRSYKLLLARADNLKILFAGGYNNHLAKTELQELKQPFLKWKKLEKQIKWCKNMVKSRRTTTIIYL